MLSLRRLHLVEMVAPDLSVFEVCTGRLASCFFLVWVCMCESEVSRVLVKTIARRITMSPASLSPY